MNERCGLSGDGDGGNKSCRRDESEGGVLRLLARIRSLSDAVAPKPSRHPNCGSVDRNQRPAVHPWILRNIVEGDSLVSKRNRVRRLKTNSFGRGFSGMLAGRAKRQRKSTWMFERLEERYLFSVTPVAAVAASGQFANGTLTPEQETMGELWWSFKQASQLSQYTQEQLQSVTQWAVWSVDPLSGNSTGAAFNPYLDGSAISTFYSAGMATADVISQLSTADNVVSFYPLIENLNAVSTASPLDEPLFESQWHLRNTGQQVNSPTEPQPLFGVPGEDINVVVLGTSGIRARGSRSASSIRDFKPTIRIWRQTTMRP